MKNFFARTITAFVFVFIIIGSICWNQFIFAAVFQLITLLGVWEFYKLVETNEIKPQKLTGLIISSLMFLSFCFASMQLINIKFLLAIIALVFIIFIVEIFRKKIKPFHNIAFTILGIIYVALPFSLLNFFFNPTLSDNTFLPEILLGFLFILWLNDTSAYLFGMLFGKHLLFPRLSPKKTWEGFISGITISLISAYVISLFYIELSLLQWILIALIIIVFSILGDLSESMLKRSLNHKDSGNLLPGHGGILDRFDGLFITVPFVLLYLIFFI